MRFSGTLYPSIETHCKVSGYQDDTGDEDAQDSKVKHKRKRLSPGTQCSKLDLIETHTCRFETVLPKKV